MRVSNSRREKLLRNSCFGSWAVPRAHVRARALLVAVACASFLSRARPALGGAGSAWEVLYVYKNRCSAARSTPPRCFCCCCATAQCASAAPCEIHEEKRRARARTPTPGRGAFSCRIRAPTLLVSLLRCEPARGPRAIPARTPCENAVLSARGGVSRRRRPDGEVEVEGRGSRGVVEGGGGSGADRH